jgi:signal transduction histidine kinase/DNA-binding LacI/PurR family transcriptional regulator/AraC-like DNA-binding protein
MTRQSRPTVGLLSTWSVYWGQSVHRYCHEFMQGVSTAARDLECNLLIAAGISSGVEEPRSKAAWPVVGQDTDFVPVGPWNTDGLIVMPDEASPAEARYIADLQASGLPVVFPLQVGDGPRVVVDNMNGIREAVRHLVGHGHRRIAFIAGKEGRGGDSEQRMIAFRGAMKQFGLSANPRLMAYGEHDFALGKQAMVRILVRKAPFTALVASNDVSCLGAIEALREAGRSVPGDVAAIGFDDVLDARSATPALTTVRHPTFALGYRAVETLVGLIEGKAPVSPVVVPTRLIVRESCGCGRDVLDRPRITPTQADPDKLQNLAWLMAQATYVEARQSTMDELDAQCRKFVAGLAASLSSGDPAPVRDTMAQLIHETVARGEDPHIWQVALSSIHDVMGLLDPVRFDVDMSVERYVNRDKLAHMDMLSELGQLTSRLLAAGDLVQISEILEAHLPRLDIGEFLVARYRRAQDDDDPVARSEIAISLGLGAESETFVTRAFPPRNLYPADGPFQAILLPIRLGERTSGFAAMSTTNFEPSAAIVSNLGAAIRAIELYQQAVDGRRLAEEADLLKSRFLSTVSHELRTPLSMVVGLSDMVLREANQDQVLSADARHDLEQMSASAQHLGMLISDVLDLASSHAGQLHLARKPLDLRDVLLDAALAGEQMARQKGLGWSARIPTGEARVMGDRTRLRQVVLNLLGNAVKFTESGSIALEAEITEANVRVSVTDTGIGVREDEIDSVFNEFHRSPESVARGFGGMGLGLAIARHLLERHGGVIGVQSPAPGGRGSRFWFTLPLLPAESGVLQPETNRRVLLVRALAAADVAGGGSEEDRRLDEYLGQRGFDVCVEYVDPAVDWSGTLESRAPAALVLDEAVAAGRGWDIVRVSRRRRELQSIPVLACRLEPDCETGGFIDLTRLLQPLEAAEIASELARLQPAPRDSTGRPTVLVVDDDPDVVELYARAVRQAGGDSARAANGRQAMAALAESRPDLVLLDLSMPEMDGFAVLEAMQADRALAEIPVIVVTGRELGDDDLERLNRCVATVLSKGVFTLQEIAGHIETALVSRPALGAATQRLVRRAIAYIEAQHAEPIRREDIARHVAITPDYLTDCFHQELGITPMAFLNRYRIRRARELLDSTDLTVTEVALATGFSGVSHFTRTFHRDVGVSPRAYRQTGRALPVRQGPAA